MDSGIDPTAASAVEARKEMVADIGRYFGIPTLLLNAPAGDSETYGTSEGQALGLVTYTLQNYINAIEDAITDQLPGGRYLQIEVDPLRRGTQYSRAQSWQLATAGKAWMTPDEVREEEGLPPAERPDLLNPPAPTPVVNAAAASLSPNTGG
jgi:phage portal protein BeeE